MTLSTILTWNLVFKGVVGGLITGLVAMGIVLVYRSSRVINFAVGSMGVPATALPVSPDVATRIVKARSPSWSAAISCAITRAPTSLKANVGPWKSSTTYKPGSISTSGQTSGWSNVA